MYLPSENCDVEALTKLELAVCKAPGKGTHATRLIDPTSIDAEARGHGHNKRYVHNILPDYAPADSLLVVEVYTDERLHQFLSEAISTMNQMNHHRDLSGRDLLPPARSRLRASVCSASIQRIALWMSQWLSLQ